MCTLQAWHFDWLNVWKANVAESRENINGLGPFCMHEDKNSSSKVFQFIVVNSENKSHQYRDSNCSELL